MKQTVMVALACFAGALIGALIALELAAHFSWGTYAWPLGALLGGGIAYLTYDITALWSGITRAFDEVVGWQPDPRWWKAYAKGIMYFSGAMSGAIFWIFACMIFLLELPNTAGILDFNWLIGAFYVSVVAFLFFSAVAALGSLTKQELGKMECRVQEFKQLFRYTNHITAPFWAAHYCFKGIRWLFVHAPSAAALIGRFVKTAFRYVHSDIRMLCFVDAALGASAGVYFGSALIGGIIGLILGVINYEVISVRVLKLVPRR